VSHAMDVINDLQARMQAEIDHLHTRMQAEIDRRDQRLVALACGPPARDRSPYRFLIGKRRSISGGTNRRGMLSIEMHDQLQAEVNRRDEMLEQLRERLNASLISRRKQAESIAGPAARRTACGPQQEIDRRDRLSWETTQHFRRN